MQRQKISFTNPTGESLAGLLETPDDFASNPNAGVALFAHCFTCSKDIAAASRISRALAARGIAVLRFDFTGLGNSDGDFANTNFSSNVNDIVAACRYLEENIQAPSILIGHSLGGAAVISAAGSVSSVRGVATIGAPSSANHVRHLVAAAEQTINDADTADVSIGGRTFSIKRQFLEDLDRHKSTDHIKNLGKDLLILHSPVDQIVSIDEASALFVAARHPKSFVSLDKADHLLSRKEDSEFAASMIAGWASRFTNGDIPSTANDVADGEVLVAERNRTFTQDVYTARHRLIADEPAAVGGADLGPNPYELLLASLGACTSMTIRMYAARKKWPLDHVDIRLEHHREHQTDCDDCDSPASRIDVLKRIVQFEGDLDEDQVKRLLEIADRCPVHRTLEGDMEIRTSGGMK